MASNKGERNNSLDTLECQTGSRLIVGQRKHHKVAQTHTDHIAPPPRKKPAEFTAHGSAPRPGRVRDRRRTKQISGAHKGARMMPSKRMGSTCPFFLSFNYPRLPRSAVQEQRPDRGRRTGDGRPNPSAVHDGFAASPRLRLRGICMIFLSSLVVI